MFRMRHKSENAIQCSGSDFLKARFVCEEKLHPPPPLTFAGSSPDDECQALAWVPPFIA